MGLLISFILQIKEENTERLNCDGVLELMQLIIGYGGYNAFIRGTNQLYGLISINNKPFICSLYAHRITMYHWYLSTNYAYSYISNNHPYVR